MITKRREKKNSTKNTVKADRKDFMRAVNMIKNKDAKNTPLDIFNRKKKLKIMNLCYYDSAIPNRKRQNLEVLPTNTQLLLSQLRKCISEHNWSAATRCVNYMLEMNGKLLTIIWKAMIVILLNHPKVTAQDLNEFLQMCLGLHTHEEKSNFLRRLLKLPKDLTTFNRPAKLKNEENISSYEESEEL